MAWVPTSTWSSRYGAPTSAWDLGPYLGPWPPAPPIPAAFDLAAADGATEFGWFVGSDPDTLTPDYHHAARYGDDADSTEHEWGDDTSTAAPSGAHLFAITDAAAPSLDPATAAPALYCAAGTGPAVLDPATVGAWSDWQPTSDDAVPLTGTNWRMTAAGGEVGDPGDLDNQTLIADEQPLVASGADGHTAADNSDTVETLWATSAGKRRLVLFDDAPVTDWDVHFQQMEIGFAPTPPALDYGIALPGVEGVDYTAIPGKAQGAPDLYLEYEAGAATFDHWADIPVKITATPDSTAEGSAAPLAVPDLVHRFAWQDYRAFASTDWAAGSDGLLLLNQNVPGVAGDYGPYTLPMAGVPEQFVMLVQPDMGASVPSQALTMPATSLDPTNGYAVAVDCIIASLGLLSTIAANAHYTVPRWRWWRLPSGIRWHNAFGHYAAAGSVALQIYTPPHGWVDIVDGPA